MDTMNQLVENLKILNKNYNVVGVKQSFEDEGVMYEDALLMRRITELAGLKLSIKIGGCEALTDIHNSTRIGVDGIVAPMIETEFALQKYIESVSHLQNVKFYINIESKCGYEHLDRILSSPSAKLLSGIVVGRSDLTKSYGYNKSNADSQEMFQVVGSILEKAKSYGMTTLMGGNLSTKSIGFVQNLYNRNLLDYIETRNVILKLNKPNTDNLQEVVKSMIVFESDWLQYKAKFYSSAANEYINRAALLMNRIDNE